jgi:protein SERAC1
VNTLIWLLLSIFFVHGLMGNLRRTWQKNDILWPKDFLGAKLPKARIITYGYDADVVRLFSRTSKNTIFDHSQSLMRAVLRIKRGPLEVCKMNRLLSELG